MVSLIDLSPAVESSPAEPFPVTVKRTRHTDANKLGRKIIFSRRDPLGKNLKNLWGYLSGSRRITVHSFPDKEFISNEFVTLSVHTAAHLDAPAHFGTLCEGQPAKSIDEVPLEWCYGDGVVLDLRHKAPGEFITVADLEQATAAIGYTLKPMDIVLINTGTADKWGTPAYFATAPGMGREATAWLVEQGIKVIGIDCYSFDRPIPRMIEDFFRTSDSEYLWPAHIYGRTKEYCHIERLANLDHIPVPYGFTVACFPIKVKGAGAGWIRAVAIIEEQV